METFLHNNAIFVVLGIAIIIWVGISVYLFMIDSKLSKLEKQIMDSDLLNRDENSKI
jgi:CcmD family protein